MQNRYGPYIEADKKWANKRKDFFHFPAFEAGLHCDLIDYLWEEPFKIRVWGWTRDRRCVVLSSELEPTRVV